MEPRGSIARPEDRTRPGGPRTGPERQLPPYGASEESDREVLLRTIREMELRFEQRLTESKRESQVASLAPKKRDWGDLATKFVAAFAAIAGVAGILKPTQDNRVVESHDDVAKAIAQLDAHQRSTDSSLEQLRAWIDGYLTVTGVKVSKPSGAPPPAIVELQPAPLVTSDKITAHQAPSIQVRTPIPLPPMSAKPVVLKPLPKE